MSINIISAFLAVKYFVYTFGFSVFRVLSHYVIKCMRVYQNYSLVGHTTLELEPSKKVYTLTYKLDGVIYKIRFNRRRGPSPFQLVSSCFFRSLDDELVVDSDVTDTVKNYAGPNHDFYGIPTTPNMLGYQGLVISYTNGTVRSYKTDEVISHLGFASVP